jgi:ABC-2 type transport system ATP-binding protein
MSDIQNMTTIEITNLSKNYGRLVALNNVNLKVPKGTIYGLVGPNGSGKTTLIKTLVGSLHPNAGNIKILGLDPVKYKKKIRNKIGYMPQSPALYEDMTARENILFFGKAYYTDDLEKKTDEIISFVELTSKANSMVRTLSGGMKKRISLCCALINDPKIIFLDEPTAAVDPNLKLMLWTMFRKLAEAGVTIFVSTHLMEEVVLCDMVTILNKGEIIVVDTPQNILRKGKTKLQILENDKSLLSVIESTPEFMAKELKKHGLKKSITKIELDSDTMEDIILRLLNNKKKFK